MANPTYSTGTVSINNGDTVVVGTGTIWSGVNARAGDTIYIDDVLPGIAIDDVTDVTHLELPAPWNGGAKSGVPYKIVQNYPVRVTGVAAAEDCGTVFAKLSGTDALPFLVPLGQTVPDPSLGADDQYAIDPRTGEQWLKTGGVWVSQGIFKPFGAPAPYDNAHTYSRNDVATSGGSSYVWVNATPGSGRAPPNATYWAVLASKGDTGSTGPAAWKPPVAWATGVAMVVGPPATVVTQAGETYVCLVPHTSGTFATDLAAAKWIKVAQKGSGDLLSTNNLSDVTNVATARSNIAAFGVVKTQVFTSSGTYTPSANLLYCIVEAVGGGGGGGGATGGTGNIFSGGGGGSGGYSTLTASAATIGASQTITIGAGGSGGATGNNNGSAGGDTSLGTLCIAKGGASGKFGSTSQVPTAGAGGVAGTGTTMTAGSAGLPGFYNSQNLLIALPSGGGGASVLGGSAQGVNATGATAVNGNNGSNYGGGGSGGATNNTTSTAAGGNGSGGCVLITEYCAA